jgi:cytochrome c oxidase subunit III
VNTMVSEETLPAAVTDWRATHDARGLTPYSVGAEGPLWWGMIGMIAIETAVFAILVTSYFYLANHNPSWPPGGIDNPKLLLPTINSFVLIASSLIVHQADKAVERGNQRVLRIGMLVSSLLALTFLILKVVEYSDVPYKWDDHSYGSIVWLIIGFHSSHVLALLLKAVVVTTLAFRGYFNTRRRLGVIINGMYWHFVVAVWIPLYIVLYWAPRWMD